MLFVEIVAFGIAWWLGLYLLQRETAELAVKWAGVGLLAYSLALAASTIDAHLTTVSQSTLLLLYALPLICWFGTVWQLRDKLREIPARWKSAESPQTAVGLILVSSITFGLGVGLLLFSVQWLPRSLLLIAIGADLLALGYAVSVLDAFEQGETLLPDFKRSFLESLALSVVFGLQIGAMIWMSTGVTLATVLLLMIVLATAIAIAVFATQLQRIFDGLIFGRNQPILQERTQLRDMSDALARIHEVDTEWDSDEFPKQVRRALSNMGNLPKLATSPLIRMPLIDSRVTRKGLDDTVLARSAELKVVLTEAICKLKPASDRDFDSADAWRHFNALYFPYVRGLRPYSRRADYTGLDSAEREALAWFQREIPQRTLYNWQNAGARLISAELQEQLHAQNRA